MRYFKYVSLLAISAVVVVGSPKIGAAVLTRYVHAYKDAADTDERFHLGELEVFASGVVPNDLGGGSFGGLTTSTNDIGDGTLSAVNLGTLFPALGTTTSLEHGGANRDPDNAMQSGGAVWSTLNGGQHPHYALDLGGTFDVALVRAWPRADVCCSNRWRNLHFDLIAADGVTVVASSGILQPSDGFPGNNPQGVTFEMAMPAVPEPTSFVVFAIGTMFAALFSCRRSRRRRFA